MRLLPKGYEVLLSLISYNFGIKRLLRFGVEPLPRLFTISQDI
jgi:hypothetical protein